MKLTFFGDRKLHMIINDYTPRLHSKSTRLWRVTGYGGFFVADKTVLKLMMLMVLQLCLMV